VVKTTAAATVIKTDGQEQSTASMVLQDDENEMIIDPENEMIIDPDEEIDETAMNYDFAMKEVILNELNSGKFTCNNSPTQL